jgi:hypothetical protein
MSHDATKVLLGNVLTNSKEITEHLGSPATFVAGLAIRQKSDDTISVTKADGQWLGVSLGKGMSDSLKTVAIARDGLKVPVLLEYTPARQVVTITSYANLVDTGNDTLKIGATTFTFKTSVAGENDVLCAASGSSNTVVGAALAAAINAHSVAGLLFKATAALGVVTITAYTSSTAGASIDCVYTDVGTATIGLTVAGGAVAFVGGGTTTPDYVAIGSKAYFSDVTGKADDPNSGATVSDATYVSGVLTGIQEDRTEVPCALVDMVGGL